MGVEGLHIFGVRHHSPAAAIHVARALDELDPDVVLIEGPSDATEQLVHLVHKKTVPPVALLAFTNSRPVRSLVYPLAAYCAEWVAARWAIGKKRPVHLIDLPASVFLQLHERFAPEGQPTEGEDEGEAGEDEGAPQAAGPDRSEAYFDDPYREIARIAGDVDHETWWERQFEHTTEVSAYRDAIFEFGRGLRELRHMSKERFEENAIREAYMRRQIAAATQNGKRSALVVCGASPAPALGPAHAAMTDAELAALPRTDCVITLMPYSYVRLSSQSGYGAGNHAPAYFEALYEEHRAGQPGRVTARYLTALTTALRRQGILRSSAEVIEAARLAEGLAAMNESAVVSLRDLRDAAVTLLGQGQRAPLERALTSVEIGSAVGRLPPGVSRTALQDDFHQLIKTLKLDKFIVDEPRTLELDLREDRSKKSKEAAFLDRSRSTFLHRLATLDIGFARQDSRSQKGTAFEAWTLRWTPECEIRLAERSLVADSIEGAAAFSLAERLAEAVDVAGATKVLLAAATCELHDALGLATRRVQELTVEEAGFASAAEGLHDLLETVRYGNVRDVDPAPLRPILQQLYLRSVLLLYGAASCDDAAAKAIRTGIDRVIELAFSGEDDIDAEPWLEVVSRVAESDDRNPLISGYAAAVLIERNRMQDAEIDREVARRLSPGAEASVGVGWFEGLVGRNRAALFMRQALWRSLSEYVEALDDDAFRRALLYLRRAFSGFSPGEIRRVVDLLGEVWKGVGAELLAVEVEKKLDDAEIASLTDDLADLDLL